MFFNFFFRVSCPHCGLDLNKGSLRDHIKLKHLKIKKYFCDVCGRGHLKKNRLRDHLFVHFDIRNFECPVKNCKKTFTAPHNRKIHLKKTHNMKTDINYCNQCNRNFSSASMLKSHIAAQHGGDKIYTCEQLNCGKGFFYQSDLVGHLKKAHNIISTRNAKSNAKSDSYKCQHCRKQFQTSQSLRQHLETHRAGKISFVFVFEKLIELNFHVFFRYNCLQILWTGIKKEKPQVSY